LDGPLDFWHELNTRRHALSNLALFAGGVAALAAAPFIIPPHPLTEPFWELWWWFVGLVGGVNAVILLAAFGPSAVRGGTYRVIVEGGVLRVESPSQLFGTSFEVPLADIARLVVLIDIDGPERHAIDTAGGVRHVLDATHNGWQHLPADRLFEAVRRLRPEIPVVTERGVGRKGVRNR
jgi:hypothetical protein